MQLKLCCIGFAYGTMTSFDGSSFEIQQECSFTLRHGRKNTPLKTCHVHCGVANWREMTHLGSCLREQPAQVLLYFLDLMHCWRQLPCHDLLHKS